MSYPGYPPAGAPGYPPAGQPGYPLLLAPTRQQEGLQVTLLQGSQVTPLQPPATQQVQLHPQLEGNPMEQLQDTLLQGELVTPCARLWRLSLCPATCTRLWCPTRRSPGIPPAGGYPAAGGYPGQQPPAAGYPGQQPPPAAGYPGQQPPPAAGYPGQQPPPAGYGQPPAAGYPQQPPAAGYPGAAPAAYAAGGAPGYPSQPAGAQPPPPSGQQLYGAAGATVVATGLAAQYAQEKPKPMAPPAVQEPVTSQLSRMALTDQPFETHGTVRPHHPFDAEQDASVLRKAMKGMGTDEKAIINLLATRSNAQRQTIKLQFKTMYGKDLIHDLKSELSGKLEDLILAMFVPGPQYDAYAINKAIKGLGTDEEILIEILCTRTNKEIHEINEEYKKQFRTTMEKDCIGDTSGHFKRLLVSMCQGNRDESSTVDMAKAQAEANALYQAGEKKWGTDESEFNRILATRNFAQLRATFKEYTRIAQRDLLNSIEREFSGNIKNGLKTIVQCTQSRPSYFADRAYRAMKGAGTDDDTLIRVIVTRSEIDLVEIKKAFLEKYHKTLGKMVSGDTSGDYKKLLVALIGQD
ncbi:annexin A5 isoform X1 [Strongylocentrotus purpuratus]|uniref:Annexin n=1 Tax=Strongylocentrotus purpuratus TaxID=7668 RepID=A0A7M7NFW1_STRPU|nr:annexin A5 isoform X1 [Strongylocentrotus purpuratus]